MHRRYAILGNSGSGKSTLASAIAGATGAATLDLDTVAWEPGQIAVARDPVAALADLRAFCTSHAAWVLEGCYGTLIREALAYRPHLILLDPGVEQCVAHCEARPWEPHKYASKQEQDDRLAFLVQWVRDYPARGGELGRADHMACFDDYEGPKVRLTQAPALDELTRVLTGGSG